jgi:hypothetical protein
MITAEHRCHVTIMMAVELVVRKTRAMDTARLPRAVRAMAQPKPLLVLEAGKPGFDLARASLLFQFGRSIAIELWMIDDEIFGFGRSVPEPSSTAAYRTADCDRSRLGGINPATHQPLSRLRHCDRVLGHISRVHTEHVMVYQRADGLGRLGSDAPWRRVDAPSPGGVPFASHEGRGPDGGPPHDVDEFADGVVDGTASVASVDNPAA